MENTNTCIKCKFYEPRSGFCRKNPPIPVVIPDKYDSHLMSAFPRIPCPELDWCGYFEKDKKMLRD